MRAYESEIDDIVTYNTVRHRVKEISDSSVTLTNLVTMKDEIISKHCHLIMVERPRRYYPPGLDWRVYRVSLTVKGKKVLVGKNMSFLEAENCRKSQNYKEGTKYVTCKGRIGSTNWENKEVYEDNNNGTDDSQEGR